MDRSGRAGTRSGGRSRRRVRKHQMVEDLVGGSAAQVHDNVRRNYWTYHRIACTLASDHTVAVRATLLGYLRYTGTDVSVQLIERS